MALAQVSKTVLRFHQIHSKTLFDALKPCKPRCSNLCTSYLRTSDVRSRYQSTSTDELRQTPDKESEEIRVSHKDNEIDSGADQHSGKPLVESENLWTKHVKGLDPLWTRQETRQETRQGTRQGTRQRTRQRTRQKFVESESMQDDDNHRCVTENEEKNSDLTVAMQEFDDPGEIVPKSEDSLDVELKPLQKHAVQEEFHLAAYVNQSQTLSQLVKLGVDLNRLQRVNGAADLVIKLDFERDVKPYIIFLHDLGIPDSGLGRYISRNPMIFKHDLENLKLRIEYLESKKFIREDIVRIVTKANIFLLMHVKYVDAKLGYLQKEYKLSGNELRSIVVRQPKLSTWNLQMLKDTRFYIKEFLGFTEPELKQLIVANPKMFLANKFGLGKRFDYLHNTMDMSHDRLLQWPKVFNTRLHVIQERHRYLLSVDRAQYDPAQENYVSLESIASGTDQAFCLNCARTSVTQFNNFLKTI